MSVSIRSANVSGFRHSSRSTHNAVCPSCHRKVFIDDFDWDGRGRDNEIDSSDCPYCGATIKVTRTFLPHFDLEVDNGVGDQS